MIQMNIEFHYYITYILASKAGFGPADAQTIAYASQYVDDNKKQFTIRGNRQDKYQNFISQTLNILKPKHELIRIHPCFHFFPGDYCRHNELIKRQDGLLQMMTTTPNSKNVNELIDTALKSGNLYRIGIATHCYVDTWAHQNFAGYDHKFNSMRGLMEMAVPDIGHADAGHKPDIINRNWRDNRLVPGNRQISNKKRCLEAAKYLFEKFNRYIDPKVKKRDMENAWNNLHRRLSRAIGKETKVSADGRSRRIKKYLSIADDMKRYRKDAWFNKAIRKTGLLGNIYRKKDGFINSHWYGFQEAVREHQKIAIKLLKSRFEQIGFMSMKNF
jgi:hypothetical protein